MGRSAKKNLLKRFFSLLGPGLVTGAADNDPSGIATYSIAGAQLGMSLLWTAFLTWPLMACVQFMCARIGMVTGRGLAGALRQICPRWILFIVAVALLSANIINIAADLAGMSDAGMMLTGINSHVLTVLFGVGIALATIYFRYYQIAFVLKWLTLVLLAYVITAFILKPNWGSILCNTFIPSWPHGHNAWQSLVAVLGTTISPYLFFWQASQEVEEEKAMGRRMLISREGATKREILDRRIDVGAGTFFSNLVMYFIILTTALTLYPHNERNIESSRQVAEALQPLAGPFRGDSLHSRADRRRSTGDSYPSRFKCICVRRNACLETRFGQAGQVCTLFLWRDQRIDPARHRDALCKNQPNQSTFWGECYQWRARTISFGRHSGRGVRSQVNATSAQPLPVPHRGRTYSRHHVDCCRRDVFFVRLSAHVICGRLFSHPCGNLICCAFSRDLLRLSSGHLCLACSLLPMRVARLPCC